MFKIATALAVAAAAFAVLPAAAHHSGAMFDGEKEMVLDGTVKEFQYTNPHSWIQVMVAGAGGAPVEWSVETAAPIVLLRAGIRKADLQPGEHVSVRVHPLRDGSPGGEMIEVKKDDGRILTLRPR